MSLYGIQNHMFVLFTAQKIPFPMKETLKQPIAPKTVKDVNFLLSRLWLQRAHWRNGIFSCVNCFAER